MSESRLEEARELRFAIIGHPFDQSKNQLVDFTMNMAMTLEGANAIPIVKALLSEIRAAERRGFEKAKEMAAECIPVPVSDSCPCNPCTEWRRYRNAIRAIPYPDDVLKEHIGERTDMIEEGEK